MASDAALSLSRRLLALAGSQVTIHHQKRIPTTEALVVVSNHRSLLDVPLLISAIDRPVRFACQDRKSTRLNSSHPSRSRMPSSA